MHKPMTTLEIAKLAKVKQNVVGNWKKRHADFPRPVATYGRTPVYDAVEIAKWLITHPRRVTEE